MKKYTMEKVLYFASQRLGLHVGDREERMNSDLHQLVCKAYKSEHIERIGHDDSGDYYKTTPAGDARLLELQIEWRKNNGKCTQEKSALLEALRGEVGSENTDPVTATTDPAGFDLRDWFAGQALAAYLSNNPDFTSHERMANDAYEMADAMMKARSK